MAQVMKNISSSLKHTYTYVHMHTHDLNVDSSLDSFNIEYM